MNTFHPIVGQTCLLCHPVGPVAFDCVRFVAVRDGSAILCSESGKTPVTIGDVVLLYTDILCAAEPEGCFTATMICTDIDYLVDQVFWQHAGLLSDRLDARKLFEKLYVEPVQILHIGEDYTHAIAPWLDELVRLTTKGDYVKRFHRIQALWSFLADAIIPFIKVNQVRISPSQRERQQPMPPRHRHFVPLRSEARIVAGLFREDPVRHWTIKELSDRVHLSGSQLSRVFADAYGKTLMAYLTMIRVEELARLLRETDLLVEDAIEKVGWHSMSYAIRIFRRYIGITPGVYRRTHTTVI